MEAFRISDLGTTSFDGGGSGEGLEEPAAGRTDGSAFSVGAAKFMASAAAVAAFRIRCSGMAKSFLTGIAVTDRSVADGEASGGVPFCIGFFGMVLLFGFA
jgi:hypothetical protein